MSFVAARIYSFRSTRPNIHRRASTLLVHYPANVPQKCKCVRVFPPVISSKAVTLTHELSLNCAMLEWPAYRWFAVRLLRFLCSHSTETVVTWCVWSVFFLNGSMIVKTLSVYTVWTISPLAPLVIDQLTLVTLVTCCKRLKLAHPDTQTQCLHTVLFNGRSLFCPFNYSTPRFTKQGTGDNQ